MSAADGSAAPVDHWRSVEMGCFRPQEADFELVCNASSTPVNGRLNRTHALARMLVTSCDLMEHSAPRARARMCSYNYALATQLPSVLHKKIRQYKCDILGGDQPYGMVFMLHMTITCGHSNYSQACHVHATFDTAV